MQYQVRTYRCIKCLLICMYSLEGEPALSWCSCVCSISAGEDLFLCGEGIFPQVNAEISTSSLTNKFQSTR